MPGTTPVGTDLPATTRCRCGTYIAFALMPSGRRMPIDVTRAPANDTYASVAVHGDHHGSLYGRVVTADQPLRAGERRHTTHYATCPLRRARRTKS
jgi:hypothetical protein